MLDGDSFEADTPDGFAEMRMIGMNANEGFECGGDAAKDALIDEIARTDVEVVIDDYDEFGRALVFVWHDSKLVNLDLIGRGLAVARTSFGHAYEDDFDAAEDAARSAELGLWSPTACGAAVDVAVRISDVNFDAAGRDDENPNGEWIDIANDEDGPVDLTGWSIRDESTRHRYNFPDGLVLAGNDWLRVRSGCEGDFADPASNDLFWCDPDGTVWSNSGDTAFLLGPGGSLVDSWSWESIYD